MTENVVPVGMYRSEDHQYWWGGRGPFVSVTTAMRLYDKSDALVGWAKKETSSFAIRNLDALIAHRQHNNPVPECAICADNVKRRKPAARDEAARLWVSAISDYQRDSAADLGTRVHAIAEEMAHGDCDYNTGPGSDQCPHGYFFGTSTPELVPFAEQYQRFMRDYAPEYLAIEYMGINTTHEYAGTGDIIAGLYRDWGTLGTYAIDIKTWTKLDKPIPDTYYPETAMQLAACSRFDFIGREGDPQEYAMPRVDAHAVLLIGRDDYRLIPYAVTDATFDAFLNCLALHRWKNGEAKTIVGKVA